MSETLVGEVLDLAELKFLEASQVPGSLVEYKHGSGFAPPGFEIPKLSARLTDVIFGYSHTITPQRNSTLVDSSAAPNTFFTEVSEGGVTVPADPRRLVLCRDSGRATLAMRDGLYDVTERELVAMRDSLEMSVPAGDDRAVQALAEDNEIPTYRELVEDVLNDNISTVHSRAQSLLTKAMKDGYARTEEILDGEMSTMANRLLIARFIATSFGASGTISNFIRVSGTGRKRHIEHDQTSTEVEIAFNNPIAVSLEEIEDPLYMDELSLTLMGDNAFLIHPNADEDPSNEEPQIITLSPETVAFVSAIIKEAEIERP